MLYLIYLFLRVFKLCLCGFYLRSSVFQLLLAAGDFGLASGYFGLVPVYFCLSLIQLSFELLNLLLCSFQLLIESFFHFIILFLRDDPRIVQLLNIVVYGGFHIFVLF